MDKKLFIKMLSGTVARGLLWCIGGLMQLVGLQFVRAENAEWAEGLAGFLIGTALEVVAMIWSHAKDKKNVTSFPPRGVTAPTYKRGA